MKRTKQLLSVTIIAVYMFFVLSPLIQTVAASSNQTSRFKDISDHWAKQSIEKLASLGIIRGYSDGTFRPEKEVTRAQFVAMVIRMMGYKMQEQVQSFVDVPKSHWAYSIVQAAIENGILIREEYNQNFEPDKPLTRQEMGMIMARTLHLNPEDPSILSFKDKDKITQGKEWLAAVVKARLITGHSDGTFGPDETLTRGQAAAVLSRLYDYAMSAEDPDIPTPSPDRETVNEVEVFDTVKEVPQQIITTLESVENNDSTFIFKGTPTVLTTLKPGDIFTLPPSEKYPSGFAEKVVSVTVEDGKTIVKTTDPDITEVFKEIDIHEQRPISFDDLIPIEISEGVSLEPLDGETNNEYLRKGTKDYLSSSFMAQQKVSAQKAGTKSSFKLSMNGINISVGDNVQVNVSGNVNFTDTKIKVDTDYQFFQLKELKVEFISKQTKTLKVSATSKLAGAEGKISYKNTNEYKGIDLGIGAKGAIPSWISEKKGTGPFEKRKSLGTFYVPVYGPAGANIEIFLVLKADLTVGVEVEVVRTTTMDIGFIVNSEGIERIKKIENDFEPRVRGTGAASASAGAGLGVKLAIYRLDVGGLEGEVGIKGQAYVRAIVGEGAKPTIDNPEHSGFNANFCYRLTVGPYYEINATIDILQTLGLDFIQDKFNIIKGPKNYKFGELSNCDDYMLVATPSVLVVAPGENQDIDVQLYKYDKEKLDLTTEKGKLNKDTVSYAISDSQIATVQPVTDGDHYKLKVKIDPNAKQGDNAELTITYQEKEEDKKLTEKIKIIVTTLDQIEVEPSSLSLKSGEQKSLSVKALLKKVNVEGYKEPKGIFERDITESADVSYKSKDETVATVNSKGVVTAGTVNQDKSTEIEISYKGITKTVSVTVRPQGQTSTNSGGTSSETIDLKQQVKDIILKAEKEADETFRPEAESDNPANFEDLKPLLKDYYTDNYLDSYWKKIYENNIAWFLDPHLLYPLTEATEKQTDHTFKVNSQTSTSITASVKVPLRDNEIPGDSFTYEYKLEKIEDKWLLDDITCLDCERPE